MSKIYSDEISLTEVWNYLFRHKFYIIGVAFICAILSAVIALQLPNKYSAKVIAISNQKQQSGLNGLTSGLGSLAGMAGISLGNTGGPGKTQVMIEVLRSQRFIIEFVNTHNLEVPIIAAKGASQGTFELIYDEEIYDVEGQKWLREVKPPKTAAPTPLEKYDAFMDLLEINYNPKTGFVELSIEFYSPMLAKKWLELFVEAINNEIRLENIAEAKMSIDYLKKTLKEINNTKMQTSFYQLIEEQTKILMLANANPEFALKTIAPTVLPERKSKPSRVLIVLVGGILGGILSFMYFLIRFFLRNDS